MTIIKIDRKEKDAVAEAMAEARIPVSFFTMENNRNLIQAEIATDDPVTMYHVGRLIACAVEISNSKAHE
jgi:hypothetical protein